MTVLVRRTTAPVTAPVSAPVTVVAAAAVFAPSSYARLRLIRRLHASGMLSGRDVPDPSAHDRALPPGAPGSA